MNIKKDKLKEFKRKHESLGFVKADGNLYIRFTKGQLLTVNGLNGYVYVFDSMENKSRVPSKYEVTGIVEYVE